MPRDTVMFIFPSFCMMLKSSWCPDKHRLLRDDFTPKLHHRQLSPPLYHTEHLHTGLLVHFILVHLFLLAHFLLSGQYFRTTWTICEMKDSESGPRSKAHGERQAEHRAEAQGGPWGPQGAEHSSWPSAAWWTWGLITVSVQAAQLCLPPRFQLFDSWWQRCTPSSWH